MLGLRRGDHDAAGMRSVPRDHEGASRQGGVRQLGTRVLLLAPVLQRSLREPQGEARAVQVRPDQDGRDHPPVPVRRRMRRALGRKDAQTIQLRGVRAVRLNSAG